MDNEDELIFIAEELKSYGRWLSDYDNAIEVLRDCGRIYYLAELCDMMDAIVSRMKKLLSEDVCRSMKINDRKSTIDRYRGMLLYIEKYRVSADIPKTACTCILSLMYIEWRRLSPTAEDCLE